MDNRIDSQKRLWHLIAELHDHSLPASEVAELQQLLSENPQARQEYLDYISLHVLLEKKHEPALASLTSAQINVLNASRHLEHAIEEICPTQRNANFLCLGKYIPLKKPIFVLACSLLIIVTAGWLLHSSHRNVDSPPEFVAVLTNTSHAEWLSDAPGTAPTRLRSGSSLKLESGIAELTFNSGAVVVFRGPADLELVSDMRVRANRGTVRARIGQEAIGFVIETPDANVVDLGTEFGVDVDSTKGTDVVVFEGAVDLSYNAVRTNFKPDGRAPGRKSNPSRTRKQLTWGEAIHVDTEGLARRIVSITSDDFPVSVESNPEKTLFPEVIVGITDNIHDSDNSNYYQIVHHGLREDARAYVDRYHEWNGIESRGMPSFLVGADYLMTFNSDKWQRDIEISVELACPANLYLFYDVRLPVPTWLTKTFTDTGHQIGVDEGFQEPKMRETTSNGAGKSIDTVYSIWQMKVPQAGVVKLGALSKQVSGASMYGIAATPLSRPPDDNVVVISPESLLPARIHRPFGTFPQSMIGVLYR